MRIFRLLIIRLLQLVPLVLVVVLLNFTLIHLAPGDITSLLAGENADPAFMADIRTSYGLDQSFLLQLLHYYGQILSGHLGTSFRSHQPVLTEILARVPATLLLISLSLLISVVAGTTLGTAIARRPGSWLDTAANIVSVSFSSIPVFWLGLMAILFFAVHERWLPTGGMTSVDAPDSGPGLWWDLARHLALPVLTLSLTWVGQYVRLTRASLGQVLAEGYVTTVRAIGFSERRILRHYALRNALLPVVTVLGLQIGIAMGGAILTETVFAWPGLGRMIYEGILARDTPVVIGAFVVMSLGVALASFVTDLAYAALDPRVGL